MRTFKPALPVKLGGGNVPLVKRGGGQRGEAEAGRGRRKPVYNPPRPSWSRSQRFINVALVEIDYRLVQK